jgi:hypothetical protein
MNFDPIFGEMSRSISYLDDAAREVEAIISKLKVESFIDYPTTINTSSGLVAGFLSGNRPCPNRYRALKKEFQKLIRGRNVQVLLDVETPAERALPSIIDHCPQCSTVALLTAVYLEQSKPTPAPQASIPTWETFVVSSRPMESEAHPM